jgi:glutathione S-transferase
MLTLCGYSVSNYYNKVKLVLLEKGIPFQEEMVRPSQDEALLKRSPLGKIPFIETEHGILTESQAIVEYLEEVYPEPRLYPADPFARAKAREIDLHIELNVELFARRLYLEAFFGGKVLDEVKDEVKMRVERGLIGLNRMAAFSPYILGAEFTLSDLIAWVHFGLVGKATTIIYGEDLVAKHIPGLVEYNALILSRPAVQKVAADNLAAVQAMMAQRK